MKRKTFTRRNYLRAPYVAQEIGRRHIPLEKTTHRHENPTIPPSCFPIRKEIYTFRFGESNRNAEV